MGVPPARLKMGGPTTHLPYLVDYFRHHPDYDIRTFEYGSKKDGGAHFGTQEGLPSKIFNTLRVFAGFVWLCIRFRPHIIHINTAFDRNSLLRDVPFSVFCRLFRYRLIFKLHGSHAALLQKPGQPWSFLIRLFFSGASRVGVLSGIEREEFIQQFGKPDTMVVVKNIVLPASGQPLTKPVSKNSSCIYGVFVSRIVAGKGLEDILAALPAIRRNLPGFRLWVAGDGPEMKRYQEQAIQAGVAEMVDWLGLVPNKELPALLKEADVFLFPSHYPEGMPMALVEALRSGIPVITTPVRFARNYLKEEEHVLFVPVGGAAELAGAVIRISEDQSLQQRFKSNNPILVEQFSKEIVGGEFHTIYSQMLQEQ